MTIVPTRYQIDVRQPVAFLIAVLNFWSSDAMISFEGDLSFLDGALLGEMSDTPTDLLPRNTCQPLLPFRIVPVNARTQPILVQRVCPQIGLRKRVIHVQVAYENQLVLAAYDQFHPACVWISAHGTEAFLANLGDQRIIRR